MENTREPKLLLTIETPDLSLYIKGVPYDQRYLSLSQYRKYLDLETNTMELKIVGERDKAQVYDVSSDSLVDYGKKSFPPIFFENGVYQIVITPKKSESIEFYHEHPGLRKAVSWVGEKEHPLLMGQLDYRNEVGYSTFSILKNGIEVLQVTLEIFPSKLSYKEDYQNLLQEVNDEIYNLAFHFIRKTYLTGSTVSSGKSTASEFFRLIECFFPSFIKAIKQIEAFPHHQLQKEYEVVRGDRIGKTDNRTRKYLQNQPHLFEKIEEGISFHDQKLLPIKGLNVKKIITYDNLENRFVKWMLLRMIHKLDDLIRRIENKENTWFQVEQDPELLKRIQSMKGFLVRTLKQPYWIQISKLDRTVLNLVMQMKPGYREAYKTYLILMKGIMLQGEMLRMSLKDVATLYEYWTYLKMGQILRKHYETEEQNIVKVKYGSLFVHLDESASAKQVFQHPETGERIILSYQKREDRLPTVKQIPDIMLEIQKKDIPYSYNYIFDAKYRINFGYSLSDNGSEPGPMEEDINTMHRYRDALVVRNGEPYERHAFGAYVLFPWHDEDNYENHPFYKSIGEVNIGGLPFLPNSVKLVERFVERLVNSNPEELQEEGILPRGSISHWESKLEDKVLVVSVNNPDWYTTVKRQLKLQIKSSVLKKEWEKAKLIALYVTQDVAEMVGEENGITCHSEIENVDIILGQDEAFVQFHLKAWHILKHTIRPVGYGIQSNLVTTINLLKQSEELPELFMKFGEEKKLWRMLRRLTSKVKTNLDSIDMDKATKIQAYQLGFYSIDLDVPSREIHVTHYDEVIETIPLEQLKNEPTLVFKQLKDIIYKWGQVH